MRISILLLLLGGQLLFNACLQDSAKSPETKTTAQGQETNAQNGPNLNPFSIQLIDGEKWLVNDEMKPYVVQGAKLINDYLKQNDSNYARLASEIAAQNKLLIKSCTMEGEAHDELHKWLHPHLALVKALENATENAQADSLVQALAASYTAYNQFFE